MKARLGALALAAAGAAACGSVRPAVPERASPAVAPAAAHAVLLRAADLPGYRPEPGGPTAAATIGAPGFRRCLDDPPLRGTPTATSPTYAPTGMLRGVAMSSQVRVLPSAAAARQAVSALDGQQAPFCLESAVRHSVAPAARRLTLTLRRNAQVATLPDPLRSAAPAFADRVAFVAVPPPPGARFPVYVDLLGFARGRALVVLQVVSPQAPSDAAGERRLLRVLYQRARSRF